MRTSFKLFMFSVHDRQSFDTRSTFYKELNDFLLSWKSIEQSSIFLFLKGISSITTYLLKSKCKLYFAPRTFSVNKQENIDKLVDKFHWEILTKVEYEFLFIIIQLEGFFDGDKSLLQICHNFSQGHRKKCMI